MKILVVGGGTAGLISALILKKFLDVQVDIVYSKDIGIVGVGEGSTEHFNDFMNFIGIDQFSIIKECDATFKSGIMFEGWSSKPYLHSVGEPFSNKFGQYPYIYAKQISQNNDYLNSSLLWKNKIDSWFINNNETPPFNQYHFNTYKLNNFLMKVAKKIEINLFEDKIEDVIFKENGEIDYLIAENKKYLYDFYIDATGFKKMLIGKMGSKWVSFSKYLKMNSAIVFPTEDEEEYNMWTLSKAMNYGWRFKIPTWGRHGNGYIFDNNYTSMDEAKQEIDKELGFDVEIGKSFSFDPGHLDKVWIKNCVAIGLSGSFVEPLEATSIGCSIQQSYLLMHKILNYSEKDIDLYNKSFKSIMENIRDYIFLHYMTKKNNSKFWLDVQNLEVPDTLNENLKIWKNRMPIREDFIENSQYSMFWEDNFTLILHGLNLFDKGSIKSEYEMLSKNAKVVAENEINKKYLNDSQVKTISHKRYIELVRNFL